MNRRTDWFLDYIGDGCALAGEKIALRLRMGSAVHSTLLCRLLRFEIRTLRIVRRAGYVEFKVFLQGGCSHRESELFSAKSADTKIGSKEHWQGDEHKAVEARSALGCRLYSPAHGIRRIIFPPCLYTGTPPPPFPLHALWPLPLTPSSPIPPPKISPPFFPLLFSNSSPSYC